MPYFQQATQYGARGGDVALARRAKQFAEMQELARFHGALPEGQEAPEAEGFKGAFFRVVDLISRPNYAVAGFVDTLQGTGKEGEYAMERAFREMFSGVAGLKGEKELFGDVLEQAGFGEGKKLSDLIGENGLTRNFNPTTRGAAGLALDIFTDPLTYVSAPIKNASVVIGLGGEVRFLNKAGLAARKAKFTEKLAGARKSLNLADDASDITIMKAIGESSEFAARNGDAAAALAKSPSTGLVEVGIALNREIGEEIVETGAKNLFEKTGLRFRPLPGVDIPVGLDQGIAKVSGMLWDGMKKTDFGRQATEFTASKLQALDQVFNQVPFLARKNTQYFRDRSEWFMRRTASEHVAALEARTMMAGVPKSLWSDRDLWRTFVRALEQGPETPTFVDEWLTMGKGKGIEDPLRFLDNWSKTFDRVGMGEVSSKLMDSQAFTQLQGRYFHRIVDHLEPKVRGKLTPVSVRRSGKANVPDRSFREGRLLATWDDFVENAVEKGVKEEDLILNPYEVAKARLTGHYEDLVTQQFLERTHKNMGFKTSGEFTELDKGLLALAKSKSDDALDKALKKLPETASDADMMRVISKAAGLDDAQVKFLDGLRDRSSTLNPDSYKTARRTELARLLRETPEGEAFQRIEEIVQKLGVELGEKKQKVMIARLQDDYRKIVKARSRADIFDQNQFLKQATAEAKLDRAVRKDLVAAQKFLKSEGRRLVKEGAPGGEIAARVLREQRKLDDLKQLKRNLAEKAGVPEAQLELKAVEQKIKQQRKVLRGLGKDEKQVVRTQLKEGKAGAIARHGTMRDARQSIVDAFYSKFDDIEDAVSRAEDLKDVVAGRKSLAAGMRDEAEDLILEQVSAVKAWKGGLKEFLDKFKSDVVQDFDGNTVRSLQDELDILAKNLDDINARRALISERKAVARNEIRQTDEVFQHLEARLSTLTDDAAYTRSAAKSAAEARKIAKGEFRDAHPTTLKDLSASDMVKFRALRPEVRAAFLHESLSQIDDIKHFERFIAKWGDEMDAVSPEMDKLARTVATGKIYDQYGQEFIEISIKTGPRAKDTTALDEKINNFYNGEKAANREAVDQARVARDTAKANRKAGKESSEEIREILKQDEAMAERRFAEAKLEEKTAKDAHKLRLAERRATPAAGGSKTFYVPQGVADDLKNINNVFLQNQEVHDLLTVYDKFSNWFKLAVTRYFPAFHVRNAYSNVAASFVDLGLEALHPGRARQSFDIMRGADGTLQIGNQSVPYEMIRQEIDVLGMRADRAMISEFTGSKHAIVDPLEAAIKRGTQREGAIEKVAGVAEKAYIIPGNVENHARIMHYISLRRRGFTPQDAGFQVNKFLFDYADLSPTERSVFRRLFPFWSWTRKNAERQIKNLYEAPGRIATQIKISTGDRGPSGDMLPEYLRGQMSVKVQSDDKGETWLTGIDMPIANIDILWAGGLGKTFREQIGLLTPLIKTPLEAGIGQDFFTGQSVHGVGHVREKLGFSMDRNLPKVLKDYFELENIGSEESPRWQANRLKLHIATKAMFISRFVSSKVQFDDMLRQFGAGDDARGASMILKMLSGMDLRGFDLESKDRAMIYNRARELEDLLINRGLMRDFTKAFIPKERKAELEAAQTGSRFFGQAAGR